MNLREKFFEVVLALEKVERLGNVGVSFVRLDDDEKIHEVVKSFQPQFQKFELVEEGEAVENFHGFICRGKIRRGWR